MSSVLLSFCSVKQEEDNIEMENSKAINTKAILLSKELLVGVKSQKDVSTILTALNEIQKEKLAEELSQDEHKKAFWINIYNAHIQIFLKENPDVYEKRSHFFSKKQIQIAGLALSFDDIEHGFIRGSKFKLALGLIKNPFASKIEKLFRVEKTDGRIHFALNCGAVSCPDIAIYDASDFDNQIDQVAQSFLKKSSKYDAENDKIEITSLFSWFRGDFGGRSRIKEMLKRFEIIPKDSNPSISYASYDWTLSLDNYYED